MSNVAELSNDNFDQETSTGITLVDFWAPWCGPCKMMGPILDQLSDEIGEKAQITKVNVDESPEIAAKYNVRSIPALFIFKDGEIKEQFVGVQTKDKLSESIKNLLG